MTRGMVYCESCGNRMHETARMCPTCGAPVSGRLSFAHGGAGVTGFSEAIRVCFSKFADFSGRANRAEFWFFNLFLIAGNALIVMLAASRPTLDFIGTVWSFVVLLPSLSVSVRRMHDTDRSGAYILIGFLGSVLIAFGVVLLLLNFMSKDVAAGVLGSFILVIVGMTLMVWQFVLYCLPGTPGPNRFGDDAS